MSKQSIEKKEENTTSKTQLPAIVPQMENPLSNSENETLRIAKVSGCIADQFVRYDGKFYHVDHIGTRLSGGDAMSLARTLVRNNFRHEHKHPELVNKILSKVFGDDPDEPSKSIALWDGKTRCAPENRRRVLRGPMMASINTWVEPAYRTNGVRDEDMSMLNWFLDKTFVHEEDKVRFLDWLAWSLQNESAKPGWAPLLYSREKGTGKSTLCKLVTRLFGPENTFTANGVSKVTGKFNKPLLDSKLLVLEELKLNPTSDQGNALKTFITEEDTSAERKGVDIEKVKQCCCFVFTTNHLPQWIEGNDRRFHVIDMGHEGHASGPKAVDFRAEVSRIDG